MLTKSAKSNYSYIVSKVKKPLVNDKVTTKFAINDYIKGLNGEKITYWITVFDDVDLVDGDRVKLLDFDNIVASYYAPRKKISYFMTAIVEVVVKGEQPEQTDAEPFVNPYE